MTTPKPRSRAQRWCPVWTLALRGSRLLRDERIAHRQTRQERATWKALAEHRAAQVVDLEARLRRLDETLDCITRAKFDQITRAMERGE